MTNKEAINWLISLTADIGKSEHHDLWHYEQALYEIKEMLEGNDTNVLSNDTISRQAVLKLLHALPPEEAMTKALLIQGVKQMDAAQPERKRGEWVYAEDEYGIDGYHCDKCGFFVPWDYEHKFIDFINDYHFCPSCGARMKGEEYE